MKMKLVALRLQLFRPQARCNRHVILIWATFRSSTLLVHTRKKVQKHCRGLWRCKTLQGVQKGSSPTMPTGPMPEMPGMNASQGGQKYLFDAYPEQVMELVHEGNISPLRSDGGFHIARTCCRRATERMPIRVPWLPLLRSCEGH